MVHIMGPMVFALLVPTSFWIVQFMIWDFDLCRSGLKATVAQVAGNNITDAVESYLIFFKSLFRTTISIVISKIQSVGKLLNTAGPLFLKSLPRPLLSNTCQNGLFVTHKCQHQFRLLASKEYRNEAWIFHEIFHNWKLNSICKSQWIIRNAKRLRNERKKLKRKAYFSYILSQKIFLNLYQGGLFFWSNIHPKVLGTI